MFRNQGSRKDPPKKIFDKNKCMYVLWIFKCASQKVVYQSFNTKIIYASAPKYVTKSFFFLDQN